MKISCPQLGNAGRLGNQLFQVAATLGIADKHDAEIQFPPWDYQPFFRIPENLFGTIDPDAVPVTEFVSHIDPRARDYLQDFNLFKDVMGTLNLSWFWPSRINDEIVRQYRWVANLPRPITAVHVRRGDLATEDIGHLHPLRPMAYYHEAIAQAKYRGYASLVFFSDDIPWCIDAFSGIKDALFFKGGSSRTPEHLRQPNEPFDDWIDLTVMAWCDNFIISNSTFAWWAAMLSGSMDVTYSVPWFGPGLDYIDADLMFPPEWKRIDVAGL